MFDIGWSEMLMIIVVMIIVIGPKDLPRVMRTAGQWIGRVRAVARHFQQSLEQMVEESGVEDARKELEKASRIDIGEEVDKAIDPTGELREGMTIEPPGARAEREKAAAAAREEDAAETAPEVPLADRPEPEFEACGRDAARRQAACR